MTRFGDFTLLDELAESEVADCFSATHDVQGGPFFLKRYRRVDPTFMPALLYRCEVLMAVQHDNLAPHLGHGDVDGVVFTVSPYLEGIDLVGFIESLQQRRVIVKLEALLYIVREVARGVAALHAAAHDGQRPLLAHGDVCTRHVRLGQKGEVWLTGLPTPRGLTPDRPPETLWDSAGLGALLYDLIPLTRTGGQRPSLPGPLDRVVRRTLGIGPATDQMPPAEFADRLDEVTEILRLPPLDARVLVDAATRAMQHQKHLRSSSAADALPTLEPVFAEEVEPALQPVEMAAAVDAFRETAPTARPPHLVPALDDGPPTDPPDAGAALEVDDVVAPLEPLPPPPARPKPTLAAPLTREPAPTKPIPVAPAADYPHRAATPLDELGGLDSVPPAPVTSAPWVAPEERTRENLNPLLDRLDVADDMPVAVDDDDLPLDPFQERTLPGHLVESLPSDEPADLELQAPLEGLPARAADGFEADRTKPDASAMPQAATVTQSDPPRSALSSRSSPDGQTPRTLDIPRAVSAIVKLDEPVRAALGLLADPPESAGGSASFDESSGAFEEDPGVAALLARGVVGPEDVRRARQAQASRGGKVTEILVATGVTTDALVADALAAEAVMPRLSDQGLFGRLPEPELCRRLPQTYALARRLLPLALDGKKLTLAVADPFDDAAVHEVARLLKAEEVRLHVTARGALTEATLTAYRALGARLSGSEGTPTVLLCMADEEETARFGARLAEEGFHVEHAADVLTAKMLLEARPPAAMLLALDLPDSEGLLVFTRGHDNHADTPLFVTGQAGDDAEMAHVLDLGADDFFERPASLNVVMAKLRRALNKRGAQAAVPPPPAAPVAPPPAAATAPAAPPVKVRPPPADVPPPTFDFWENSVPLDEMPEPPPGDTEDSGPMFAEPTGVMGTLRQMAVSEIVQSLELGRKTARVELVPADGQRGMVGFEDGRVVYAECGDLQGQDAFFSLARHTEGFFRIRYGEGPSERNVEGSTTFLLLEAMRQMDEEGGPQELSFDVGADKTPTPFD